MTTPALFERATHAARHPVATAAYLAGLVRGTAAALLRAASGGGGPATGEWTPPPEPLTDEAVETPESEIARDLADAPGPAREREPEPARPVEDWYDETDHPDLDAEPAEGVVEALERGDRDEDLDEGELNAILSESETLRKAADLDKG